LTPAPAWKLHNSLPVGRELAVALTREDKTARGGENAADHRLRRLHLPFDLVGVIIDGGNVARLRLARDRLEGAAKPQLAVRIRRVLDRLPADSEKPSQQLTWK
jgi:hypothetical protein